MSLKAETFYALQCDFPGCGQLWEGYEYTYFADGPDASEAHEDGWFVNSDTGEAFCSAHTVEVECPLDGFVSDPDGERYCQWCEDHSTDTHLGPMPDIIENRLRVAMDRVVNRAHYELDRIEDAVCGNHGPLGTYGSFQRQLDERLVQVFERTCRSWKPDITAQELYDLLHPKPIARGDMTNNQLGDWVLNELRANLYPTPKPRSIFFSFSRRNGKNSLAAALREAYAAANLT